MTYRQNFRGEVCYASPLLCCKIYKNITKRTQFFSFNITFLVCKTDKNILKIWGICIIIYSLRKRDNSDERRIGMVKIVCQSGEYTYMLSQSTIISEDFSKVQVYGISIIGKDSKSAVEDISDDFDSVYGLFSLIVEGELCPEHLECVVEDFLSADLNIVPFKSAKQHTA